MSAPTLRIDLAVFADNIRTVRARVAPAELLLVVKDDAYGHGLDRIVMAAVQEQVSWFGSSDLETALAVRFLVGASPRILAWPAGGLARLRNAVAESIDLGVGDLALLDSAAAAAKECGVTARVHLKIDTGLRRNGFRPEQWGDALGRARGYEDAGLIEVVAVWSHIAEASDDEDDAARALFDDAVDAARQAGCAIELRHLAASAASFARPEFTYDLVRVGAFCFGIRSADGPSEQSLGIRPIASFEGAVTQVSTEGVTVALGSFDGVPSTLGARVEVGTPGGRRALLRVDEETMLVEAWPGAAVGDTVVLFGPGGAGEDSATTLAESIGTIGEEILLRVSPLVSRAYR